MKRPGFTLVELVIGMTLLVIGVMSVFTLAFFSMNLNHENKVKTQALELAREGLEMVRNIRDSNWKNNYPFTGGSPLWGTSLDTQKNVIIIPTFSDSEAPFIVKEIAISSQPSEDYRLKKIQKGGVEVWSYEGIELTPFYRYIELTPVDDNMNPVPTVTSYLKATAHVEWFDNGRKRSVVVSTLFTDWRKL